MIAPCQFSEMFINKIKHVIDLSAKKRSLPDTESKYAMQLCEINYISEVLDFTMENIITVARSNIVSYEFLCRFCVVFESWLILIKKSIPKPKDRMVLCNAIHKLETTISIFTTLIDEKDILQASIHLVRMRHSDNVCKVK